MDCSLEEEVTFAIWSTTAATHNWLSGSSNLGESSHGLVVGGLSGAHVLNRKRSELFVHVQEVEEVTCCHLSVRIASSVAEETESQSLLLGLVGWVIWLEILASMVTEGSPPVVNGTANN